VQDFPSTFSGQIPVKQDDVRPIFRLRSQQGESLLAVLGNGDSRPNTSLPQCTRRPPSLSGHVFDQQDLQWPLRRGPARSVLSSPSRHFPSSKDVCIHIRPSSIGRRSQVCIAPSARSSTRKKWAKRPSVGSEDLTRTSGVLKTVTGETCVSRVNMIGLQK